MINKFQETRPYNDAEIAPAMARIAADPLFEMIRSYLFADKSAEEMKALLLSVKSVDEFQHKIMYQAICRVLELSNSSYTVTGLENLTKNGAYTFISNHRDIVLDSAILQVALLENGFRTTEITFGSNLMRPNMVVDIGKSNKMFKVVRATNTREFLVQSHHLSEYIRHTIAEKCESLWIAQRNGRTKDGNDLTEQGLIKMLSLSGDCTKTIAERLQELNIVPMTISYQYEPCDALKVQELYISSRQKYEKAPNEDLHSILTGIQQNKGNIVIHIGKPMSASLAAIQSTSKNDVFRQIAEMIDYEIHSSYHLFDTNYIAWDLLHNSERFLNVEYSEEMRNQFFNRMNTLVDELKGDRVELTERFLKIYAYPLINKDRG